MTQTTIGKGVQLLGNGNAFGMVTPPEFLQNEQAETFRLLSENANELETETGQKLRTE